MGNGEYGDKKYIFPSFFFALDLLFIIRNIYFSFHVLFQKRSGAN